MKQSQATKTAKNKMMMFRALSILLTVTPLAYFVGMGFATGTPTDKIAISMTALIGITFAALNVLLKWHIRSGVWIVIFGLCYAFREKMDYIISLSAVMAGTSLVDEFIVHPLAKRYKEKFRINKEIDKRI